MSPPGALVVRDTPSAFFTMRVLTLAGRAQRSGWSPERFERCVRRLDLRVGGDPAGANVIERLGESGGVRRIDRLGRTIVHFAREVVGNVQQEARGFLLCVGRQRSQPRDRALKEVGHGGRLSRRPLGPRPPAG